MLPKLSPAGRLRLYGILLIVTLATMAYLYRRAQLAETPAESAITLPRDLAEISAEGRLRILAPYEAFASGDSTGRAYALARYIGAHTPLEVEVLLEDNTERALEMLRLGAVDLIAHPFVRTADIDTTQYTWIQGTTSGPLYLVQRADTAHLITRQLDLADLTITLPEGSPLSLFVHHLAEEIGDSIHINENELYNAEQLIIQVASGDIDYTICSEDQRDTYRALHPNLDFSLPLSYSLRRGWLVRRASLVLRDSIIIWDGKLRP